MAQTYPLDCVIQKVAAGVKSTSDAQKVIIIDAKKKQAVEKRPILGLGDLRHYLVSNNSDVRNIAQGEVFSFQLRDLESNVGISVSYQVSCRPGNEQKVAVALFDPAYSPGEALENHIKRWLIEFSYDGLPKFITSYFADRDSLQGRIRNKAMEETGLDLQVKLFLDAEKSFHPIRVESDRLPVRVLDYAEEQDLMFQAELDVDEENKTGAILNFSKNLQLQQLIPQEVKKYIKQQVTMQQFCIELNRGEVKQALVKHLNEVLKPAGRKVGAIVLEAKPSEDLQFYFQDHMDVPCSVQQYPNPIIINNKVQMILKDIAKYKAAKSPDLRAWLQDKLGQVIPQLLFDAKYINLLISFQPLKETIEKALRDEAEAIGYALKQLITIPDLEPIKWKENFTIDTEGTFETRLSNVHVKLHIVVTARINNLEEIETYLNRQQNVPKLMEEAILSTTRQYLHGVDPERFYMGFSFPYKDGVESVEKELVDLIKRELEKEFHAEVIDVIPKVVDTELITRLRRLQEKLCPFEVGLLSLHGGELVLLKGKFQVEAVDSGGWHKFQLRNYNIDGIRQHVEEHILATLQTLPNETLAFKDQIHRKQLEKIIKKLVEENVVEEFGLRININNIHRVHTQLEIDTNQQRIARYRATLELTKGSLNNETDASLEVSDEKVARLKLLLERRTAVATQTGNEDEVKDLNEKIDKILEDLKSEAIPSIKDVEELFLPSSAKKASLREFSKLLGLLEAELPDNNRGEEEANEQ